MKIAVIKVDRENYGPRRPIMVTISFFNEKGIAMITLPLPAKLFPSNIKEQDVLVFTQESKLDILVSEHSIKTVNFE